jgi:hypothetical protein
MLIDLTQHFVEVFPHVAPTTLVVRAMDTSSFRGEVEFTPGNFIESPFHLAPDISAPSSEAPMIWQGPRGDYYGDGPGRLMEWRIGRPGSYWIGSARWELPQPDKERKSIKYRASQILFAPGATRFDLVTELQGDPTEHHHTRIHIVDYNPNSAEPVPLSGEVSSLGRSRWERLDDDIP